MTTTEHRNGTLAFALQQHVVRPMEALPPGEESNVGVYAIHTGTVIHYWVQIVRILQHRKDSGKLLLLKFEGRAMGRQQCVYCWNPTGQLESAQNGQIHIEGLELV